MPPQPAVAMAAEAEAEAQRLSPASLSAARQHVSTLNTTEREALLRALLEQYDRPEGALAEGASMSQEMQPSSRPRHPASASSASAPSAPSAHPDTIFECPSLLEEEGEGQDDGLHHPTALAPAPNRPKRSASSSTSTSWPIRSMSASAVTAQHTPRQPQVRSHSISHSALRSSFSTKRQTADSVALFHYRSKSYAASPKPDETKAKAKAEPELEPKPQPEREKEREKRREKQKQTAQVTANAIATTAPAEYRIRTESTESAESTETTLHSGLNIITSANAYILQGPATVENSHREPRLLAYGCTSCGDQFSRRAAWAEHDATCRLIARHNGRRRHARPQRAWACGFCAAFLGSVERYQDHVAGHFERGKTLAEWHYANVIYGLLHQPVVHKAWKRIWAARAAALPEGHRPKATWPSDCQFPTRRTDAYARSTPRTSFDTRDSSSTDDDGKNIVYLGLREALESFDPAVESASVMVLHAESLAIFISVPIKDGSRSRSDLDLDKDLDLDLEKDKNKDKDKQRSRAQPRDWGETGVQIATAAAMATATATIINSTPQREGPQSPKPDTFAMPAAMPAARATTAAAAAAASSPTTVVAPMTAPAPASAPPAPPTLGTSRRSKDDPLPALPVLATPAASSTNSTSSTNSINSSNKATKKDSKSRRASVRATALNPLSLFRSKDDSASKDKDKEKSKDKDKSKAKSKDKDKSTKSHKARLLPLGSTTAVTAETLPSTAPDRPPLWSDRPLPPLIMDGNPAASLAASSSSPPSPSSSPDTQARLVSADHYTLTSPASSSSLPPKADALDMDSMAAAYVDDFMTSINAKRVVHG